MPDRCQLQWHLEPLVIISKHVNFLSLKNVIDEKLKEFPGICYYAFADKDIIARMAEKAGMQLQETLIYKGEPQCRS